LRLEHAFLQVSSNRRTARAVSGLLRLSLEYPAPACYVLVGAWKSLNDVMNVK